MRLWPPRWPVVARRPGVAMNWIPTLLEMAAYVLFGVIASKAWDAGLHSVAVLVGIAMVLMIVAKILRV